MAHADYPPPIPVPARNGTARERPLRRTVNPRFVTPVLPLRQRPFLSFGVKIFGSILLLLGLFCSVGCSSYVASADPTRKAKPIQVYFVKSNLSDNRGIDGRLVRALQARGFKADKGPMTMMPQEAQAIVTYEDHWNWDFTTHLTGLRIEFQDTKTERPFASSTFSGPAALTVSIDDVIDRLLDKMLKPPAPKKSWNPFRKKEQPAQ
jgi:hypothetical protein